MIDLLAVYICPKHGEVLEDHVHRQEEIDTENDETYLHIIHDECDLDVTPKIIDESPCFEKVDHERWLWATGFYDELLERDD
jgi:hypothetical protein